MIILPSCHHMYTHNWTEHPRQEEQAQAAPLLLRWPAETRGTSSHHPDLHSPADTNAHGGLAGIGSVGRSFRSPSILTRSAVYMTDIAPFLSVFYAGKLSNCERVRSRETATTPIVQMGLPIMKRLPRESGQMLSTTFLMSATVSTGNCSNFTWITSSI